MFKRLINYNRWNDDLNMTRMMRSCQTNKAKLFVVCWCPAVPELDYHQLAKRVVKAGKNFNKSQHLCNLMPQGSTACRCDAQP